MPACQGVGLRVGLSVCLSRCVSTTALLLSGATATCPTVISLYHVCSLQVARCNLLFTTCVGMCSESAKCPITADWQHHRIPSSCLVLSLSGLHERVHLASYICRGGLQVKLRVELCVVRARGRLRGLGRQVHPCHLPMRHCCWGQVIAALVWVIAAWVIAVIVSVIAAWVIVARLLQCLCR